MAKRNTRQAAYQPRQPQPKRRAQPGKTSAKSARASAARSHSRSAAPTPRVPGRASLLMVRVAAVMILLGAVIGGTAWATSLKGAFGIPEALGLILLAFLAGLALIVAARTEVIAARVAKLMRERRG